MAITSAIMQMRRGEEEYFDPDKMHPGEWAVSTDTKYVRMCMYPGVCVRMATYEAFEEDMAKIEAILTECRTIEELVTRINNEVSANAQAVAEYTAQAKQYRDEAEMFKNQAAAIVGVDIASKSVPGLMAGGENTIAEDGTLTLTRTTTDRTLTDSYPGGAKINYMEAVESQHKQYSGKNFLENKAISKTVNGVTFTVNEDKSVKIVGTASATTVFVLETYNDLIKKLPESGKIVLSGCTGGSNTTYSLRVQLMADGSGDAYANYNEPKTITYSKLEEKDNYNAYIHIASGATVNTTIYPMISVDGGEYEPFVGNQPSPNPDYPQEIESVEVGEIWTHGKNWFKFNNSTTNVGGITMVMAENEFGYSGTLTNGITRASGSVVLPAGTYVIRINKLPPSGVSYHLWEDITYSVITPEFHSKSTSLLRTFTLSKETRLLFVLVIPSASVGTSFNVSGVTCQIEKGSVATPYEPHTEKKITLSNPITLRGIGDGKDVLCKRDGVYKTVQIINEKPMYNENIIVTRVDGWTNPNAFSVENITNDIRPNDTNIKADILCSHFQIETANKIAWNIISGYIGQSGKYLYVSVDGITDAESLKNWLRENQPTLSYVLAEPIITDLPLADQIALHQLETFGTVTYLSTDSEIEPIMEVEYGTSKVGGYALEAMLGKEANRLTNEQFRTLINEMATRLVAGSEV